jgi:hypothetical protein
MRLSMLEASAKVNIIEEVVLELVTSSNYCQRGGLEPPYRRDSHGAPPKPPSYKFEEEEEGKEGWEKEEEEVVPLPSILPLPLTIAGV